MDYGKYFDALKRRNAALPDQSGVTKETYIRLIAKCLSEYGKVNDLRTATPDTVFSGLHAYSRIVTSMAAIVNYGLRRSERKMEKHFVRRKSRREILHPRLKND